MAGKSGQAVLSEGGAWSAAIPADVMLRVHCVQMDTSIDCYSTSHFWYKYMIFNDIKNVCLRSLRVEQRYPVV